MKIKVWMGITCASLVVAGGALLFAGHLTTNAVPNMLIHQSVAASDPYDPIPGAQQVAASDPYDPIPGAQQVAASDPYDPIPGAQQVAASDPYDPIPGAIQVAASDPYDPVPSPNVAQA